MKLCKSNRAIKVRNLFVSAKTDMGLFVAAFVFFFVLIVTGTFLQAPKETNAVPGMFLSEMHISHDTKSEPEKAVLLSDVNFTASRDDELSFISEQQYAFDAGTSVLLFDTKTGTCSRYPLEEYVTGALLAEMPTAYEPEALKAQAVSCRTYALYKMTNGTFHENGADLCTNPAHCQAFSEKSSVSKERYEKARQAVKATEGEVMLYDGKPILAVFHASSGRKTKSSEEVWGGKLSYLCSVQTWEIDNPELSAAKSYSFTFDEFFKRLSSSGIDIPYGTIPEIKTNETLSGKVTGVDICGKFCGGSEFVRLFGLRSSDFDISVGDDAVNIVANGYGHGVGLSQLGSQDLAQKGYSYREILGHYYTGVTLGIMKNKTAL